MLAQYAACIAVRDVPFVLDACVCPFSFFFFSVGVGVVVEIVGTYGFVIVVSCGGNCQILLPLCPSSDVFLQKSHLEVCWE